MAEPKERKALTLILHDAKKDDLLAFATENHDPLAGYHLVATGATGKQLQEQVGLSI